MSLKIRKCKKDDLPQVLDLIKELAAFEKEPDAVEVTLEELEKEGFGTHPLYECIVAEIDNKVVGMALFYFRFSTWKGRSLHLEDLIVKQNFRAKGIGNALYRAFLNYCNEKEVRRAEWVVLDWNQNAIDFYEKSGAKLLKDWYLVQMDAESIRNFEATKK
ncbi:MAG TPA: GNAT family N-acetyltransferase [Flavobacteriaceae bacterium]|nr:GNAT family N-acetyltransferase [Flavobacteriaceae bacterium]